MSRTPSPSPLQVDVQPTFVRLLIKGRLLQLVVPEEVRPDAATAQRSKLTGDLLLTMPKLDPGRGPNPMLAPSRAAREGGTGTASVPVVGAAKKEGGKGGSVDLRGIVGGGGAAGGGAQLREVRKAAVQELAEDDEDYVPPL
jgi:protein TilB